ncbi:MAG: RDD family protein [Blastocatellia bacterium]|nr:RDD family protein [Blastocatellia bacterium]
MMVTVCRVCRTQSDYRAKFCHVCGASIPTSSLPNAWQERKKPSSFNARSSYPARYAGFWKRFAASLIDSLIVSVLWGILLVLHIALKESRILDGDGEEISLVIIMILPVIFTWLYASLMESSPARGTLGKMALGIAVTGPTGSRISFGRATGRHFGKILSSMFFGFGYLMAAFTEKKQALHDLMAGCLVVNKKAR